MVSADAARSQRVLRGALGGLLILHGVAHIALGLSAENGTRHGLGAWLPPTWTVAITTALLLVASPGFVAAGLGLWNAPGLRAIVSPLVRASIVASFAVLLLSTPSMAPLALAVAVDLAILVLTDATTGGARTWRDGA